MHLTNTDTVLIGLYRLKDTANKISFRDLENFIGQDRSQLSQALQKNEQRLYVEKEPHHARFDSIIINEKGIARAKAKITIYAKFLLDDIKSIPKKLTKEQEELLLKFRELNQS